MVFVQSAILGGMPTASAQRSLALWPYLQRGIMDVNVPTYKRDSQWYQAREAELEATQRWRNTAEWWCAKHPGACPECGHRLSAHKELGDCERFSAEGYARDLAWDAGQRGYTNANPCHHDDHDPDEAALWKIYEDSYQKGVVFRLGQVAYCQGWDDGHRKLDRANPHPSDTDAGTHYEAGYQDGAVGDWHRWGKIEPC